MCILYSLVLLILSHSPHSFVWCFRIPDLQKLIKYCRICCSCFLNKELDHVLFSLFTKGLWIRTCTTYLHYHMLIFLPYYFILNLNHLHTYKLLVSPLPFHRVGLSTTNCRFCSRCNHWQSFILDHIISCFSQNVNVQIVNYALRRLIIY